jgi:ABC-type branched-subunit amino acid transport system ATPase component
MDAQARNHPTDDSPAPSRIYVARHDPGTTARKPHGTDAAPARIELHETFLKGPRGPVYGPLSGTLRTPVSFVLGPHGSGRTSLLLTLGGRMRPSSGSATVDGLDVHASARALRRHSGIAGFIGIDELEDAARVDEAIRERLIWASPWYARVPRPSARLVASVLAPVFGPEIPVPSASTLVRELTDAQDLLLRIALALAEGPQLLFIDDLDAVSSPDWRAQVLQRLKALTDQGVRFVAGTADARDVTMLAEAAPDVLRLAHPAAVLADDPKVAAHAAPFGTPVAEEI